MAGNREAYQHHMNMGNNAAWDQNWTAAIKAYSQAIHEFAEDPEAHINLGLSLLQAGRLDDALKVYTRAHQLAPDDPTPLEKSADILERMGRLKEAAQQYVFVSDIYLSQRDLEKAIGNWERATQLTPGLVSIHAKLAQAYERVGDKRRAVREYLTLAFNFQRVEETEKAIKAVERALRLDKRNPQALNTLRALKSGGEVTLPEWDDDDKPKTSAGPEWPADKPSGQRDDIGDADPLGPMGEALNEALATLAAYVFESGSLDAAGSDALQAMELQRQELHEEAIAAYQRAEPRLRHPALKLNLGVLLLLADRPDDAVKHLGEATMDPNLSAGALHALGQAYFKLNKQRQAARYLIQSLQAVDTSLAMNQGEVSELTDTYTQLLTPLDEMAEATLQENNQVFLSLLQGKDWKQRIPDTRRFWQEHSKDRQGPELPPIVNTDIASSITRIDSYIRQGLLTLAMDEAHRAVEVSPYYLPLHVRMAEIMMREGRLRHAIDKYNAVARSYMARDENDRAASILSEVLEMAPLNISVRTSLIELLESEERMDEMLDQYIDLAKTYNQLGNFDLSRETYQSAERLARRIEASPEKLARIKHSLADMDQMRLDTRRALRTYEEIVELVPEDERAYRMLVELNYNQGNSVEAVNHLDKLLKIYAKRKQISKIVQMLEDLVKHNAADTLLRSRLAAIYKQLGRKEQAIEQLDALGELQLEAGLHDDARSTIKQIIELKPDHVEDYRKLLAQLGG